ncbi:hypothetical protein DVH24_031226 [Malus domestica]|uniref:Uncharacterized protein n=1 Tax=Malus domestica TaxID=3750 RepID=A0A498HIX2_MALDO|nr:hypothetical protein DVH24_031226 [Malus domestica]
MGFEYDVFIEEVDDDVSIEEVEDYISIEEVEDDVSIENNHSAVRCGCANENAGEGVMCLICTCSPPYSTRYFGNSLVSDSIGTPKLSEFGREQSQDG